MPKSGQYDILEIWKRNFLECSFYVLRGQFSDILGSLKPHGCSLPKTICFGRYWYEHISYRPKTSHSRFFACHFSFFENAPLKPQYFVRAPFLAMIARRIFGKCAIEPTIALFGNVLHVWEWCCADCSKIKRSLRENFVHFPPRFPNVEALKAQLNNLSRVCGRELTNHGVWRCYIRGIAPRKTNSVYVAFWKSEVQFSFCKIIAENVQRRAKTYIFAK